MNNSFLVIILIMASGIVALAIYAILIGAV